MSTTANVPCPPDQVVLAFANRVLEGTRKSRKARMESGKITPEEADRDIRCAEELKRLAEDRIIFEGPPLN